MLSAAKHPQYLLENIPMQILHLRSSPGQDDSSGDFLHSLTGVYRVRRSQFCL
jgi:hypothetical protein